MVDIKQLKNYFNKRKKGINYKRRKKQRKEMRDRELEERVPIISEKHLPLSLYTLFFFCYFHIYQKLFF